MTRQSLKGESRTLAHVIKLLEEIADRLDSIEDKLDELNGSKIATEFEDTELHPSPIVEPEPAPH